jgi:hypothetical protein
VKTNLSEREATTSYLGEKQAEIGGCDGVAK